MSFTSPSTWSSYFKKNVLFLFAPQQIKSKHSNNEASELAYRGMLPQGTIDRAAFGWAKLGWIKKLSCIVSIALLGGIVGTFAGAPLIGLLFGLGVALLNHTICISHYNHRIHATNRLINESQTLCGTLDETITEFKQATEHINEGITQQKEGFIILNNEQKQLAQQTTELNEATSQLTLTVKSTHTVLEEFQGNVHITSEIYQKHPEQLKNIALLNQCIQTRQEQAGHTLKEASNTIAQIHNTNNQFNAALKELQGDPQQLITKNQKLHTEEMWANVLLELSSKNRSFNNVLNNLDEIRNADEKRLTELNELKEKETITLIPKEFTVIQESENRLQDRMDRILLKLPLEPESVSPIASKNKAKNPLVLHGLFSYIQSATEYTYTFNPRRNTEHLNFIEQQQKFNRATDEFIIKLVNELNINPPYKL